EAIVAHEYFHNWSGNRVTCRDWFQLSLKEGFTVFRDGEFTADTHARAVKRMDDVTLLRTAQFAEDAGPMAHPIRPDAYIEINNFYTVTVYEKGAEVVRMLHTLLGAETFRRGSDLYFERFDGQAVTTDDFVACMAEVSGIDLSQFKRWYSQAGTPHIQVQSEYDAVGQRFSLHFTQFCAPTPGQSDKLPLHIPVRLGLLGRDSGQPLSFYTHHTGFDKHTGVFSLRDAKDTLVLEGVSEAAVPSLLRDFSAPVVCEYDYSADDLCLLIRADENSLNRWDAMQALATRAIIAQVQERPDAEALRNTLTKALADVLADEELDWAVKARLLQLPSLAYLAEQYTPVDPLKLYHVQAALRKHLAQHLKGQWHRVYETTETKEPYAFNHTQAARRALHLQVLSYLVLTTDQGWQNAQTLYQDADNMTEQSAALTHWAEWANAEWDAAMAEFYHQWEHDAQVVEKWLGMCATAPHMGVEDIQQLLQHPAFSWHNPNRVRSVIGGFVMRNPVGFHARGNAGYRFLADTIIKLDRSNPQIAARL
ncbi:MAG: DUF3458 domain-containing protein, partial [Natronospirillum sp.]